MNIKKSSYYLPHPYIMLFLAPVLWSTSNVTSKLSRDILTPYQFTFYRWLLASIILTVFAWKYIKNDMPVLKERAWWLFMCGGSAFCIFNILLYSAFSAGITIVDVSIIHALIPVLVILGSMIFFREHIHFLQWFGMIFALFGVLWLLTKGHPEMLLSWKFKYADILILISALIYAAYSIALRKAPNVHWSSLMWAMSCAATVVALPFFMQELASSSQLLRVAHPSSQQIMKACILVVYVTIFVAIISKMFYMEGVIALGASRGSLVMNLLPVFNSIMGLILFSDEREAFNSIHMVALICVIGGIIASEIGARLYLQNYSINKK